MPATSAMSPGGPRSGRSTRRARCGRGGGLARAYLAFEGIKAAHNWGLVARRPVRRSPSRCARRGRARSRPTSPPTSRPAPSSPGDGPSPHWTPCKGDHRVQPGSPRTPSKAPDPPQGDPGRPRHQGTTGASIRIARYPVKTFKGRPRPRRDRPARGSDARRGRHRHSASRRSASDQLRDERGRCPRRHAS